MNRIWIELNLVAWENWRFLATAFTEVVALSETGLKKKNREKPRRRVTLNKNKLICTCSSNCSRIEIQSCSRGKLTSRFRCTCGTVCFRAVSNRKLNWNVTWPLVFESAMKPTRQRRRFRVRHWKCLNFLHVCVGGMQKSLGTNGFVRRSMWNYTTWLCIAVSSYL